MNDTSLNSKCEIEGSSSFQSVLAHDLAYRDSFLVQIAHLHIFLNWDSLYATARHRVGRKRSIKRLNHTENLFRKK